LIKQKNKGYIPYLDTIETARHLKIAHKPLKIQGKMHFLGGEKTGVKSKKKSPV
jgi:hypothetical protein